MFVQYRQNVLQNVHGLLVVRLDEHCLNRNCAWQKRGPKGRIGIDVSSSRTIVDDSDTEDSTTVNPMTAAMGSGASRAACGFLQPRISVTLCYRVSGCKVFARRVVSVCSIIALHAQKRTGFHFNL